VIENGRWQIAKWEPGAAGHAKKLGLLPRREVNCVDQPEGVLVVKASKRSRGKRVLAALLRGGKVKGDTESWLRLTRGTA